MIFADQATTGDGMLTAVALLDIDRTAPAGRSPSWPASAMTSLPQVLVNVAVAERVPDVAELLADEIAAAEARTRRRGPGAACAPAAPSRWCG